MLCYYVTGKNKGNEISGEHPINAFEAKGQDSPPTPYTLHPPLKTVCTKIRKKVIE